jgi:ANTAR domain.
LIIDKQPVSVTSAEPGNTSDIATSLRLSLAWVPSLSADSRITFYASTPGTFVDLAADLAFALHSHSIRLDEDIPSALVSDLTGAGRLSAINQAVGVLISHGHTPDSAQRELRDTADATSCGIQNAAETVTDDPSSTLWNRR